MELIWNENIMTMTTSIYEMKMEKKTLIFVDQSKREGGGGWKESINQKEKRKITIHTPSFIVLDHYLWFFFCWILNKKSDRCVVYLSVWHVFCHYTRVKHGYFFPIVVVYFYVEFFARTKKNFFFVCVYTGQHTKEIPHNKNRKGEMAA